VAAHEHDDRPVVGDGRIGRVHAVVFEKRREANRPEGRADGGIDVPLAGVENDPDQAIRLLRRNERRGVAGAEELRHRRRLLRRGDGSEREGKGNRDNREQEAVNSRHKILRGETVELVAGIERTPR
jgi:hypothetical protein